MRVETVQVDGFRSNKKRIDLIYTHHNFIYERQDDFYTLFLRVFNSFAVRRTRYFE